jgi:hypothetical protein
MYLKDTIITIKQKKHEILFLLFSFVFSNILNVTGIICYKTSFSEIYTQLFIVIILTVALYSLSVAVRLVIYFIKLIFKKKKM